MEGSKESWNKLQNFNESFGYKCLKACGKVWKNYIDTIVEWSAYRWVNEMCQWHGEWCEMGWNVLQHAYY
jgi:hypothetical protein